MNLKSHKIARALTVCAFVVYLQPPSQAADGTWGVDSNGFWSTPTNWVGSIVADGATSTANFTHNITDSRNVTLGSSLSIGNLNFSDNGSSGSAWNVLRSNDSIFLTLGDGVTSGTSTINTLTGASIYASLAGTNRLNKTGNATLNLRGTNSYTGGTTIGGGTLGIHDESALGATPVSFDADNLLFSASGTLANFSGAYGSVTLGANRGVTISPGATAAFQVYNDSPTTNTVTVNGVVTGGGNLTKTGNGILALAAANTYTGTTRVSAGVLRLDNANALSGGIGTTGGTSALVLDGGVIGLTAASGDFTRSIGTGTHQVTWASGAGVTGGFAAFGGNRSVNFGGANGTVIWTNSTGTFNGGLILGHSTSDSTVTVTNGINLNSLGTRNVIVNDGSAAVDGILSGVLTSGSSRLNKSGDGTLALTADNTYGSSLTAGTTFTTISAGTLQLGNGGATGSLTSVGSGDIQNDGTLAINRSNAITLQYAIKGSGALRQIGAGITTLTGANTYTGATVVTNGTLSAAANGAIGGSSGITVSAGTLLLAGAGTDRVGNGVSLTLGGGTLSAEGLSNASETLGALIVSANSTIDFGVGLGNAITFSSVGAHTAGATLAIVDWTGVAGQAGGVNDDRLIFLGSVTDFTSVYTQADVSFNGGAGYTAIDLGGGQFEVVAIPEPAALGLLAGAAMFHLFVLRRRNRA